MGDGLLHVFELPVLLLFLLIVCYFNTTFLYFLTDCFFSLFDMLCLFFLIIIFFLIESIQVLLQLGL